MDDEPLTVVTNKDRSWSPVLKLLIGSMLKEVGSCWQPAYDWGPGVRSLVNH